MALDKATGELVERATYQAYGGAESDYRPGRWGEFREDYRFTGKEEDVEVGLTYFGKRFYSSALQRWVSADPLGVHAPYQERSDDSVESEGLRLVDSRLLNLYAYVSGQPLRQQDVLGLVELEVSTSEAFFGDGGQVTATQKMAEQMQGELERDFGIATVRTNDWNGADLDLADADAMASAKADAEARMRAAGATSAEIARWELARNRLVDLVGSSEDD